MPLTVIVTIISFPSPTLSFVPDLKPFSANPSTAAFLFFFRTDYVIPQTFTVTYEHIRFYFLVVSVLHFLVVVSERTLK